MSEVDMIQKSNLRISWSCDDHVPSSDVLIKLVSKYKSLKNNDICIPLTDSQIRIVSEVIDGINIHFKKLNLPSFHFSTQRIHILPQDEFNAFSAIIIAVDSLKVFGFQKTQRIYLRADMDDWLFAALVVHELIHAAAYQHEHLDFHGYTAFQSTIRLGIGGDLLGPMRIPMHLLDEMITEVVSIQIRQLLKLSSLSAGDQDLFSKVVAYPDAVMLFYDTMIKAHQKDGSDQRLWRILLQDYFLGTSNAPRALYQFDPSFYKKLRRLNVDAEVS